MITWGINALNHGSSLAVIKDNNLLSLSSGNGDILDDLTISRSLNHGHPDRLFWYEQPWLKKARQLRAGQYSRALDMSVLPSRYLKTIGLDNVPVSYTPHHASHAAAGYYTSPFDNAAVVVLDAIGEFECASIWHGKDGNLTKVWSRSYPHSLGLFYSAFTQLLGLTPLKDESMVEQLAANGNPSKYYNDVIQYLSGLVDSKNLHKGVSDWTSDISTKQDRYDLAAAVQTVFEEQVGRVMTMARILTRSTNLVYMGGCAMNQRANLDVVKYWNKVWSLPNPGDASSAIGAVLYHTKQHINWTGPLAKHITISV